MASFRLILFVIIIKHVKRKTTLSVSSREETPKEVYLFDKGIIIYPSGSRRGVLRSPLYAESLKTKINGLTGFKALGRVDLYFDGSYWSLSEGTLFGADKKRGRKTTIG